MKIGDYVRTKNGIIGKIIDKNMAEVDNRYELDYNNKLYYYEQISKSSSNIIDLIEVGDYVNGCLVLDIAYAPKKAIYLLEKDNHFDLIPRMNKDIKSIITKEQFEEMEYKI